MAKQFRTFDMCGWWNITIQPVKLACTFSSHLSAPQPPNERILFSVIYLSEVSSKGFLIVIKIGQLTGNFQGFQMLVHHLKLVPQSYRISVTITTATDRTLTVGFNQNFEDLDKYPETTSKKPLKIDGWKITFLLGLGLFSGVNSLLASGRVNELDHEISNLEGRRKNIFETTVNVVWHKLSRIAVLLKITVWESSATYNLPTSNTKTLPQNSQQYYFDPG